MVRALGQQPRRLRIVRKATETRAAMASPPKPHNHNLGSMMGLEAKKKVPGQLHGTANVDMRTLPAQVTKKVKDKDGDCLTEKPKRYSQRVSLHCTMEACFPQFSLPLQSHLGLGSGHFAATTKRFREALLCWTKQIGQTHPIVDQ